MGRERLVGISIFMGEGSTPSAVVPCAGQGLRLDDGLMRDAFDLGGVDPQMPTQQTMSVVAIEDD